MSNVDKPDIMMDAKELFKEDTFTDQKVGTIRRMTPVTAKGEIDTSRRTLFIGQAQMMTPAGALPLSFEIESEDLAGAVEQYGVAANKAMEDAMEELQEMRRKQASQIVVPGAPSSQIQIP